MNQPFTRFRHFAITFLDNGGRGPPVRGHTGRDGSIVIHVIMEGTFDYTIQYGSASAAAAGPLSKTFPFTPVSPVNHGPAKQDRIRRRLDCSVASMLTCPQPVFRRVPAGAAWIDQRESCS